MPLKPLSPCLYPSCPAFAEVGECYCKVHKVKADKSEQDRRGTSTHRGYGSRWQRLRLLVLARDPVCRHPGCTELSTDVDHVVPKSQGGTDTMENLQGLCHGHHSLKTDKEDGGFGHYRP